MGPCDGTLFITHHLGSAHVTTQRPDVEAGEGKLAMSHPMRFATKRQGPEKQKGTRDPNVTATVHVRWGGIVHASASDDASVQSRTLHCPAYKQALLPCVNRHRENIACGSIGSIPTQSCARSKLSTPLVAIHHFTTSTGIHRSPRASASPVVQKRSGGAFAAPEGKMTANQPGPVFRPGVDTWCC